MTIFKVFKHLKLFFFSHKDNNHTPHILKEITLIIILLASFFFLGVSYARYFYFHKTVLGAQVESSVLIDLTNETRIKYNESPLTKNPKLELAANLKADDMVSNNYFAHNSPTGVTPWFWIKKAGYNFIYAGENLAIDFTQSQDIEEAWLKSPEHRANILNENFKEIGITTKEGKLNGRYTIFVVQMFGTEINSTLNNNLTASSSQNLNKNSIKEKDSNTLSDTKSNEEVILLYPKDEKVLGEATTTIVNNTIYEKYSSSFQKFIFYFWYRLNTLYKVIISLILFSVLSLFFVEFKKHHWKHILYGVISIIVIILVLYFNYSLF
ncbi:MAG: hypothetical protein QG630_81 [Patescibacteria group bacterium]|nr:hypothetical protein [Patescibacteria group bacterium]